MGVDGQTASEHDQAVDFGGTVKRELRNQQRNQEWLAHALDVDRATISRMLARSPTLEEVDRIAEALGITPTDLLRAAGYLDDQADVETMLAGDVSLDAGEREMLLAAYRRAKELRR